MAEFVALRVESWVRLRQALSDESRAGAAWKEFAEHIRDARYPVSLYPWGKVRPSEPVARPEDAEVLSAAAAPDFEDVRLRGFFRRVLLGTAEHRLSTWEPRLAATLGIAIPEANLIHGELEARQWQATIDAWIYPTSPPPRDLWFLAEEGVHCGIASSEQIHSILSLDSATGLFARVANYYCGPDGEFAWVVQFLRFAAVQRLWVYFTEERT